MAGFEVTLYGRIWGDHRGCWWRLLADRRCWRRAWLRHSVLQ